MNPQERMRTLWSELYDGEHQDQLESFLSSLESQTTPQTPLPEGWYRDVVVYSL